MYRQLIDTALISYQNFSSDRDPHENLNLKLVNFCQKTKTSQFIKQISVTLL